MFYPSFILVSMYFDDLFWFTCFSHGYFKEECPVLDATPSMTAFLDYDFLPEREKVYMPKDFHSILGLPLDSEQNETALYNDDYIDDSIPVQIWKNALHASSLSPVNMNQDKTDFTEASTLQDIKRNHTPYYTTSPSLQDMENHHIPLFGGDLTLLNIKNNQTSSYTTTSIPEADLEKEATDIVEAIENNPKTTERSTGPQYLTTASKESM